MSKKSKGDFMSKDIGYIYILTNEKTFNRTDWVKIGYSSNIDDRLKSLFNTSVPYPYELYAAYEIPSSAAMAKSDKVLHSLIEKLNPMLRLSENREFFNMEPEEAYEILLALATIHGREDKLVNGPGRDRYLQNKINETKSHTNLPRMDWCIQQGLLKIGDKVYIRGFENEIATILDERSVCYNGKKMTFNSFGCLITGWKSIQIYAFLYIVGENQSLLEKRFLKMQELNNK